VIFALLPFELDAIRRARDVTIADRTVHVVTPEDLILMKIISEQPRDVADAERSCAADRKPGQGLPRTTHPGAGHGPRERCHPQSLAQMDGRLVRVKLGIQNLEFRIRREFKFQIPNSKFHPT
jgi:hypothetical protein